MGSVVEVVRNKRGTESGGDPENEIWLICCAKIEFAAPNQFQKIQTQIKPPKWSIIPE